MLPIRLTIEGIYSYQARQTIDFASLVNTGLFGIFGTVGSGKSSILEAITFALYGETERLHLRDKRYYNMMNLKSNRSYIEFDFINFENRLFRATREFKRNSKNFDDVKTSSVQFYESKDDIWIPIEATNASDIVGLSYDNFKRTIIIPQGRFKEFIELGPAERTKMMKEIFNLQKYDLQDNASKLMLANKSELDQLAGRLSGYDDVSPEAIDDIREKLSQERENQQNINGKLTRINEEFQQLKALKEEAESLEKNLAAFRTLSEKKQAMHLRQQEVDTYDRMFKIFSPWITEKNIIEKEVAQKSSDCSQQREELGRTAASIAELETKLAALKPDFDALDDQKQRLLDLETVARLKELDEKIQVARHRTSNGKTKVAEYEARAVAAETDLGSKVQDLEELKSQRADSELLVAVSSWYQTYESLAGSRAKVQSSMALNENEIHNLDGNLLAMGVDRADFKAVFDKKYELLTRQIDQAEKIASQLQVEDRLAQYAHTLRDGEPCPLCGALEHPHVSSGKDVSSEIRKIEEQLAVLARQKEEQLQLQVAAQNLLNSRTFYQHQLLQLRNEAETIDRQIKLHREKFVWNEFDMDDPAKFAEKARAAKETDRSIANLEDNIKAKRQELDEIRRDLDKFDKGLQLIKLEEARHRAEFDTVQTNLRILSYADFSSTTMEEVRSQYSQLELKIGNIERVHEETESLLHAQNIRLASAKATLDATEKALREYRAKLQYIDEQINHDMRQNGIEQFDEVLAILHKEMDTKQVRLEIEQFTVAYETLKNKIDDQQAKFRDTPFDHQMFEQKKSALEDVRAEWSTANESVAKLEVAYDRLQEAYHNKKTLLEQQASLQKRAENLKAIFRLLKGNGFVQYVSSIYLRQLCDHANVRFHRMTRNQLSLTINENNDFEIVDYLNEGRSRSVKTLSGGQAFQVSLSLALALAESVQSNAMADKNFFFIDEGFGTQDNESVNIVFETLLSLQRENRIVGIISHVEELKERIPISISVHKDEERGSLISLD